MIDGTTVRLTNLEKGTELGYVTAEQKKAKESAERFMIYLYKKYYSQIEVEMEKREELRKCGSSRVLLKLGLSFISYLRYNKRK